MTGTPSGVGAFKKPRQALNHEDVVTVEITGLGTLENRILFPEGQAPLDLTGIKAHEAGSQ